MKKQRNYAWLAVLIVFVMAAVPSVLPSVLYPAKTESNIAKNALTVKQVDYSDPKQLEQAKKSFSEGCFDRPCKFGLCNSYGRQGERCDCCAADAGGLCSVHKKPATPKPGGR